MKAQMKIQQTAFMLIAITLFFALVGMAVLGFKFSDVKQSATELEARNAKLLVSKLANSPEFSCGEAYGNMLHCVDADKVMMLKQNPDQYQFFWGVSNIEIRKLYPKTEGEIECTLSNYPNCNIIKFRQGREGTYDGKFVSLCRKVQVDNRPVNKCELAELMVSYEKK